MHRCQVAHSPLHRPAPLNHLFYMYIYFGTKYDASAYKIFIIIIIIIISEWDEMMEYVDVDTYRVLYVYVETEVEIYLCTNTWRGGGWGWRRTVGLGLFALWDCKSVWLRVARKKTQLHEQCMKLTGPKSRGSCDQLIINFLLF